MSVDLPNLENESARELARWISEEQVERAIAYLELVRLEEIQPGPEIERVLGSDSLLTWTVWELVAVQNRLGLVLCIKRNVRKISAQIHYSIFRRRQEVKISYFSWRNYGHTRRRQGGTPHTSSGYGARVGGIRG